MSNKLEAFFKSYADSEEQLDFRMAHETVGQRLPAISTGTLALDDALSSGGLPKGRLIQYYGAPGSGKSLMAMIAMKEAQAEDPEAQQVFIDAEQTFDPAWAETIGVDTSKVIIVDGDTAVNGRKCFEMVLGVPKEDAKTHILKGKAKEGLLDKIMSGEFNINLVVLDSLGSIIPPGEDISVVGKMNMALLARFLTTTFRKLSLEVSKAKVPFIIINHKKANMDPYGVDHTFSGGNTYSHFLSANVYFEPVNRADAKILDDKDNKIGQTIRATIEKSKFGPWPRKCEFKVDFGVGVIDKHEEIAQLALDYNIVTKPTSVTHEYGEMKWVGFGKFCDAIKESQELAEELKQKISEARDNKWETKRQEQEALKNKSQSDSDENDEPKKKRKAK
jgi:recombination protein RecA